MAESYLGYYDPARRTGGKDIALYYEDTTLCIHILFETSKIILSLLLVLTRCDSFVERDTLLFVNSLDAETVSVGSALHVQAVTTSVSQVTRETTELSRIFFKHYIAQERSKRICLFPWHQILT